MARQATDLDEDDLLDDSFDLPSETLTALEQQAIVSTQQPSTLLPVRSYPPPSQQQLPSAPHDTLELPPERSRLETQLKVEQVSNQYGLPPSSDYGNVEDGDFDAPPIDMADPAVRAQEQQGTSRSKYMPGEVTQREHWRMNRYGKLEGVHPPFSHLSLQDGAASRRREHVPRQENANVQGHDDFETEAAKAEARPHVSDEVQSNEKPTVGFLRSQIQELLRERQNLQQSLSAANSTAFSKAGEIAIVRANHVKASKENERKITALQKLHADEIARQKADLEQAVAERERVNTENKFLKRDLTEEEEKIKTLKRSLKKGDAKGLLTRETSDGSPWSTPRRGKVLTHRDGFDDDEIVPSPSKALPARVNGGTPKSGAKRKRKPVDDSPAPPLQLSPPKRDPTIEESTQPPEPILTDVLLHRLSKGDGRFEFLESLLNQRPQTSEPRIFETLTTHFLPSNPTTSFTSLILSRFTSTSSSIPPRHLPIHYCHILIDILSSCLAETYFPPLSLLLSSLTHTLLPLPPFLPPELIDTLIPLAQILAEINVVPIFQRKPPSELNPLIPVSPLLCLMHLVSLACIHNASDIRRFWRFMRYDFVLMVMNPVQPLADIEVMLDLLRTSILASSFGPIVSSVSSGPDDDAVEVRQAKNENYILERLTGLLTETPRFQTDNTPRYPPHELNQLRLATLSLLLALTTKPHGIQILAAHPSVIVRLVKTLHDETDTLYDYRFGHEIAAEMVNTSTKVLYRVLTKGGVADVQRKLLGGDVVGGSHKYMVGLTRLAFSAGEMLEQGVEDAVVEMARALLEEAVTPGEGEGLIAAMGGGDDDAGAEDEREVEEMVG